MNWVLTREAHKQLMKLPKRTHDLVVQKMSYIAADFGMSGQNWDIKKLVNRSGFRLRVGDYRVIYVIDKLKEELVVLSVGHRREVYR